MNRLMKDGLSFSYHKNISQKTIINFFKKSNIASFISGCVLVSCIWGTTSITKGSNTRSENNHNIDYSLSGVSSTYNDLEMQTSDAYLNYTNRKKELKMQKSEYNKYINEVDKALKKAAKDASEYLKDNEIIKRDENNKRYISINDENWQDAAFCIYDERICEYDEYGLAKLLACKLALADIDDTSERLYYALAYYIDNNGEKQYFHSSISLLSIFPTWVSELEDIKYDLVDSYIENYIGSKRGLFSKKYMSNNQNDIVTANKHTIGNTIRSEKNTGLYRYKYNPKYHNNPSISTLNMTRAYRR